MGVRGVYGYGMVHGYGTGMAEYSQNSGETGVALAGGGMVGYG